MIKIRLWKFYGDNFVIKELLLCGLVSTILSSIAGYITIPLLSKIKAGQPILKYVESHKQKNGTPTMGGLFFIVSAVIVFYIFNGFKGRISTVIVIIGLSYMVVGFLDDFIKIRYKKNEGLKAYQKIIFQLFIAIFAGVFCYRNGLTVIYLPFVKKTVDIGVFIIPLVVFIFIATTNSVNLTDGLDGLAGSVSVVYLLFIIVVIYLEITNFNFLYIREEEYLSIITLAISLMGALIGFLFFNSYKASVFMGDTGSLSLGGFIGGISIFSSNSLFIPILGALFVVSSVSVIIQVVYFKATNGKRVFLMAPLHHHLQLKGHSESKISFYYSVITGILGVFCVIFYI